MRSYVTPRTSWWAQAVQNWLIALVLAMIVVVPLIACPIDDSVSGIAALTFECFAVVLLATLLWRANWDLRPNRVRSFLQTGANLPVLGLLALTVLSCALAPEDVKVFSVQETMKLTAGVLLYFVMAYQFRQSKHLSLLVDALLFVTISTSLIAMAQYQLSATSRATALFGNQQVLGSFLMILLPMIAVIAINEKSTKRQLVAQFATVLTAGCLMLTYARSAWIGAVAGLIVLAALALLSSSRKGNLAAQKHKLVLPAMLAVLSIGFFVVIGLQTPTLVERVGTLASGAQNGSWQIRQQQWQGTVQMIGERPLTGWGTGLYPLYQSQYTGQGVAISPVPGQGARISLAEQAHNFYLQTAAELGLPGLLLIVAVLLSFLVVACRRVGKMDPGIRRSLLMGSIASTVAFSVDAMSSPSWQFGHTTMFFWMILGVGVSCIRPRVKQEEEEPVVVVPRRLSRPATVALCGLMLAAIVPTASVSAQDGIYNRGGGSNNGTAIAAGVLLALTAVFLNSDDDKLHPIAPTDSGYIPTLPSSP